MAPSTGHTARASRPSRSRSSRGHRSTRESQQKTFSIPYFAHQELDHHHHGQDPALTLPVGKPGWAPAPLEIATATNGGWEDDEEVPLDWDPDGDATPETVDATIHDPRLDLSSQKNPYRQLRVAGGRPAVAKKVTADLDSDDELIVRMKNAKYLEKDIAKRLTDEGRTAYNPKTIGTRWARIRKALAARNDDLLDAQAADWHAGDDDALYQAYQRADEVTERAKTDAESRRWRVVADELKHLKPVTNFSQHACRNRYEALRQGTAKPTPESVRDPDEITLVRIRSRQEKEARIRADAMGLDAAGVAFENLEGNGWTSKRRKYL